MSAIISPPAINGISLVTRAGKPKSRYSAEERLRILGGKKSDLNATIKLFCPDGPLYAATRRDSEDPRAWMTPRGRLPDSEVLRHLTGNLTPEINPRWVAPHSWEATWWIGIDVDYRGDRDDFQRRCEFVIQAFGNLGIPSNAILKSITPSGGRHYRFFTTRKVRVSDIPQVMAMVGLHESSGQIEIFPKLNKGMRLPFGYIPGREHDPRKWLRFIRAYRRRKFPRMNWLDCLKRAFQHANPELNGEVNRPGVNVVTIVRPTCEVQRRRVTRINMLGIPKRHRTTQPNQLNRSKDRYRELLSRPFTNPSEATELWHMGICAEGTRIEATKRLAWHLLFVRRLPLKEAANRLVEWVYETGSQTSAEVRADKSRGTRSVEEQTRQLVQWIVDNHAAADAPEHDLSRFSVQELQAILEKLHESATDELVSVALSFLRFAKLHGAQETNGWLAQVSVNGVIRKWPGCGGMKYKPFIEGLKACGLIEVTREKRQSSNGTGRPRTYLIRVQPELRTGAAMSHEDAIDLAAQAVRPSQEAGMTTLSHDNNVNTYRRSIPPTSSEKKRKIKEEVGQERIQVEDQPTTPDRISSDDDRTKMRFRQAEAARLAGLSENSTTPTPTCPLTITRSSSHIQLSSGPMDQMVTTVQISGMGSGHGQWPRRFRQWHRPRQDVESTPAPCSLMSLDRSIVSARDEFQQGQQRESHEYAGRSP